MKKLLLALILTIPFVVSAQVQDPVKWIFTAKKITANTYEIHLTATIGGGWHTYSQTTPKGGPVPTAIEFTSNPLITMDGTAKEVGKLEQHHEPMFDVDVKQFSGKIDFVQKIKLTAPVKTALNGTVQFMVCNDKQCLPPKTVSFNIALK